MRAHSTGLPFLTETEPVQVPMPLPFRFGAVARRLAVAGIVTLLPLLGQPGAQANSDTQTAAKSAAAGLRAPSSQSRPGTEVLFPAPLSNTDAARYRRIFVLQDQGNWPQADREIAQLKSRLLMGHVLFQRYMHPTAYRASYPELEAWLRRYKDHPGAYRAYSLARQRQPEGAAPLTVPDFGREHLRHLLGDKNRAPTLSQPAQNRQTAQTIRWRIARSHLTIATRMIDDSGLPAEDSDRLLAQVALGWLALGQADKAQKIAARAAARSRDVTSVPDWVAGLAAFAGGDYALAMRHFALHAESPLAGGWNQAAGAFWAARSAAKLGARREANRWLNTAAEYPFTFYGQLALEQLGRPLIPAQYRRPANRRDIDRLMQQPGSERVFALIQAGQVRRADEELLQYLSQADMTLARAIMAVAEAAKLPQAAMRAAFYLANRKEAPTAAALYPTPNWRPQGGFEVDQALIWAFVRQESVFNPRATSGAGARGLMQLMPKTANYVAGKARFEGAHRDALYDPALNLSLGQQYLKYLMTKELVDKDLFRLAVAYNAGIGNLLTWRREGVLASDPLMFIETLPLLETRLFVERVVANYWIYRALMGQPRPSLKAVLGGQWPRYSNQETAKVELAEGTRHAN